MGRPLNTSSSFVAIPNTVPPVVGVYVPVADENAYELGDCARVTNALVNSNKMDSANLRPLHLFSVICVCIIVLFSNL